MPPHENRWIIYLAGGDLLAVGLFTLVGFASHGELAGAGSRMLSTFIPVSLAWGLVAPWLGLYDCKVVTQARQLWRPILAAVLAAPLAGWLRGIWLDTPILPVFVAVMMGFLALSVLIWRILWFLLARKQAPHG